MIEVCTCRRIYSAVFDIWRKDAGDLEAVMTCYQILTDLGKVLVLCETAHLLLFYDFLVYLCRSIQELICPILIKMRGLVREGRRWLSIKRLMFTFRTFLSHHYLCVAILY